MSGFGKLYRGVHHFDFPKAWRTMLAVSAMLLVVSVGALIFRGLNLGIDFEGGTSLEVKTDVSVSDARNALASVGAANATIQTVGSDTLRIRTDIDESGAVDELRAQVADLAGVPENEVSVSTVGPSWGEEITNKATRALIFFFIAIAAYISVRLEWKMAIGALIAVAHDILISVGLYALFQFEVTPATVIAFLTIMGYSLYDTIVVYDKVREITGRVGATGRYTYTEMMNLALNQVFMRSLNTTITSVLPVLSMLLIGSVLLGAVTLREFAIALLIGLIVGGYSSLFVASAVVAFLKEREPGFVEIRRKVESRDDDGGATRKVSAEDASRGAAPKRAIRTTSGGRETSTVSRPAPTGAIPPRPRKQKRKK